MEHAGALERRRMDADRHDVEDVPIDAQRPHEYVELLRFRHLHRRKECERRDVGAVEKIQRMQ